MKNIYGFDKLSRDVLILSVALGIVGIALWRSTAGMILSFLSTLFAALMLYRTLSAPSERRQYELLGYEKLTGAITGFFKKLFGARSGEAGYKYFKCPDCGKKYRAPKGKGKIRVTCSECGKQFEKKV